MPTTEEPLGVWIARSARDMEGQDGVQHTLDAAVRLALLNIDGAESVCVSVSRRGKDIETPAFEGSLASDADRLQFELDEGPCLSAIKERKTVFSPSLADDERWPTWGPRAHRDLGASSALVVRLFTDGTALGALSMYSAQKNAFTKQDRTESVALAAHVAVALAAVQQSDALLGGLDTRSVIGQAMGIVMERFSITPAVAFALLERLSGTHQVKLRVMAQQIVTTRSLPE